jgi:hypothetical protein
MGVFRVLLTPRAPRAAVAAGRDGRRGAGANALREDGGYRTNSMHQYIVSLKHNLLILRERLEVFPTMDDRGRIDLLNAFEDSGF